ncbi:MAG: insulinase family protein [Rhodobacteraceae bacterium]|nr:insulinase family protein [Alphaproteobacteria bacterium]NNF70954.1 insulinase family protein [Paracoccaceae bacterium]NNK65391.1 insulinase family protein [Paracoccaceae bacterium]
MKYSFAIAVAWIAVLGVARAAEVSSFTLDNGMEVVVLEDNRAPVVVHMVWYRVGSADEPPGKTGIAHFLEHLMFKGTETTAPREFSEVIAANGGSENAFTSPDYTAYFQRIAADRLELMMKYEADRMVNLKLLEEDVATEREVVLEERNQRVDGDPGSIFTEQRRAAQYINHPYGNPVIGWRHEIMGLTLEDAKAFYRDHYAPNNAVLVVAGDASPEEVRRLAETYYGVIPPNPDIGPRVRPADPPHRVERRLHFEDPRISQPYVIRTYLAPERDSGDQEEAAALFLLSRLLGGSSATSVLGQSLQFEKQIAIHTSAFYSATSYDDNTFGLFVVPAPGYSLEEVEEALDSTLDAFLQDGIDEVQLARIKSQHRASDIYAKDNLQNLARTYGAALTSGLTVADVEAWPDIVAAVTADEILSAARRVLDREKSVTGWLSGPEATEEEVMQ